MKWFECHARTCVGPSEGFDLNTPSASVTHAEDAGGFPPFPFGNTSFFCPRSPRLVIYDESKSRDDKRRKGARSLRRGSGDTTSRTVNPRKKALLRERADLLSLARTPRIRDQVQKFGSRGPKREKRKVCLVSSFGPCLRFSRCIGQLRGIKRNWRDRLLPAFSLLSLAFPVRVIFVLARGIPPPPSNCQGKHQK